MAGNGLGLGGTPYGGLVPIIPTTKKKKDEASENLGNNVSSLSGADKSESDKKSKATETKPETKPETKKTESTSSSYSGSTDTTPQSTYKRLAQYKDFDDDNIIRMIRDLEAKGGYGERSNEDNNDYRDLVNEYAARHPEDSNAQNKAEIANTSSLARNKMFYNNIYQDLIDSDDSRRKAISTLEKSGGKPKGIYGPTVAFLLKEFGDPSFAVAKKSVEHKLVDASNGEELEGQTVRSKKELDVINKRYAEWRKEQGLIIAAGKNGKYNLVDKEGKVISTFKDKASAEKWFYHHYDMGEATGKERYSVSYRGQSYRADNEEDAKSLVRTLNSQSRSERLGAVATWLSHLVSGIFTRAKNDTAQFLGNGRPYKSTWQTEIENRIQGNNETYYENEKGKNNIFRNALEAANNGLIDLDNVTNRQLATFNVGVGERNAAQTTDILRKQQMQKAAANEFSKWDTATKNAYTGWMSLVQGTPLEGTTLALVSGNTSIKDLANLWKKQTNITLTKDSLEIKSIEAAIKAAGLQNRMTEAQVDVIKELVAEQLQAAKLNNADKIRQMATTSVDSVAKIIDAIVPM